ncbi:MAG: phage tail protein [Candidatus Pacebacteria bacterium]|jgi:microcystin-dependent protein|nr:phage tail protein [Candidatus Paceibacterota bacterium]
MKHQIATVLKISSLALVLSLGLSYALAWTPPTSNPPSGNVAAPINASATAQEKLGDLTLSRLFTTASSSIGTTAQTQTLTVAGTIGATGDICTAVGGGSCLSTAGGGLIDPTPIGSVASFAGSVAPSGYLICDGTAVSRTTYASLFAVIGTTYGAGNGSTTFNLPDLRGEFIRGLDKGRGIDAGRALGSWQADLLKSHTHTAYVIAPGGGYGPYSNIMGPQTITTSATGGAETRPRNVAMNYVIKALNNSEMVLMATSTVASLIPAGAVMHFDLATCPTGWLPANGTGGTVDLRGEFIRGLDSGRGVDAGRTLASAQGQAIQSHTHTFTAQISGIYTYSNVGGTQGTQQGGTTAATGGTETRPRNVALLACVKS